MTAVAQAIIERLAKMKSLAREGVGGERENAARLLKKIAAKYGIDIDCIDAKEEEESDHPIDIPRGWKLDLVIQLLALMRLEKFGSARVIGHCCVVRRFKLRKGRLQVVQHFARCTTAQFVELQAKFAILSRDFDRKRKSLYRAFLLANDLLLPYDPYAKPPTDEETELAEEARDLSAGIEKSILSKQLPAPMSQSET